MGQAAERILVVRVGRVGDIVMITPALRQLLDGFPTAELHMLTSAEGARVLRGFDPRIAGFHLYHRRFPGSWLLRRQLAGELRGEGFARIYVLESHPHYRDLVAGLAPEVHWLGASGLGQHTCVRLMSLVEPTLPRPLPRGWLSLPVSAPARERAAGFLADHGLGEDDVLVGLHLTFSESARGWFGSARGRKHREWPLGSCAELATRLHEWGHARGVPLRPVIDVLPHERAMAKAFRERVGGVLTVLGGPPDFERYKAVLARLRLLVTPNTGPMHVAAAVGTPVVALFSGWSPQDCGPFVPPERYRVIRAEDCTHPERGLAAISAEAAFEACGAFLP